MNGDMNVDMNGDMNVDMNGDMNRSPVYDTSVTCMLT